MNSCTSILKRCSLIHRLENDLGVVYGLKVRKAQFGLQHGVSFCVFDIEGTKIEIYDSNKSLIHVD